MFEDFFLQNPDAKILLVGHNHEPSYRPFMDGSIFINTGTWIKMFHLDFSRVNDGTKLTYAQIDVTGDNNTLESVLNEWEGTSKLPYNEFV